MYSQFWKRKRLEEEEINKGEVIDDINQMRSDSLPF